MDLLKIKKEGKLMTKEEKSMLIKKYIYLQKLFRISLKDFKKMLKEIKMGNNYSEKELCDLKSSLSSMNEELRTMRTIITRELFGRFYPSNILDNFIFGEEPLEKGGR